MINMKISASVLLACVALAGCGGSDDSQEMPEVVDGPSAEGAYLGALTSSQSSAFKLLILENGEFWTLYGNQYSDQFLVAGLIQGSGTSDNGNFTSSNAKDFGFAPALEAPVNATYDATAKTIKGAIKERTNVVNFNGGPLPVSQYNYNTAASLNNIAGSWTTQTTTGENVLVNIATAGTFSAVGSSGCRFSGTVTPRASGKNVFDTKMTFGPAPCALAGQAASGIALSYPLANGKNQLILAQVDSTRTYGLTAFGIR
jgi:hypothetical protein